MALTQELHIIRAHHLYHSELLTEFAKTVQFVFNTRNPAMDSESVTEEARLHSRQRIEAECRTLLSEIERLQKGRKSQDQRLKNVMNLVSQSHLGTPFVILRTFVGVRCLARSRSRIVGVCNSSLKRPSKIAQL